MDILSIAIIAFVIMEFANIIILYFFPTSRKGNGVACFNAYERSKEDSEMHNFVRYLVNWVAGTKLIFIFLLVVIVIVGSTITKIFGVVALILSILSYFWRLNPIIRKMDREGQITPKGYSKTLCLMIICFVTGFALALLIFLALNPNVFA